MAVLVKWEDYKDYLSGREPPIPEKDFSNVARKTMRRINSRMTNGFIPDDVFEQHKDLIVDVFCELAELVYTQEEQLGLNSNSITGQSLSFDKSGTEEKRIISQLWTTRLLYMGG